MSTQYISIIIPVYNRANLVKSRSLKSALRQTDQGSEIVVVDDGSSDDLESSLRDLIDKKKVIYLRQKHKGVSAARNLGVKHAKGKVVVFLDSDDELKPNYISSIKECFAKRGAEVVIPGFILQDERGRVSKATLQKPRWMLGMGGGIALKKSVFTQKGIWYDERLRNFEDSDFGFRVGAEAKIVFLNKFIYVYHFKSLIYKESETHLSSDPQYQLEHFKNFKEKHLDFYRKSGPEALSFLYFWEGTLYAQSDLKCARKSFIEALRVKPSLRVLVYLLMASFGSIAIYRQLNRIFIYIVRKYKILRSSL